MLFDLMLRVFFCVRRVKSREVRKGNEIEIFSYFLSFFEGDEKWLSDSNVCVT